jgi:hypothetical protein
MLTLICLLRIKHEKPDLAKFARWSSHATLLAPVVADTEIIYRCSNQNVRRSYQQPVFSTFYHKLTRI